MREIKFRTWSEKHQSGKHEMNYNPLVEMDANPPLLKVFADKDIIFMQYTGLKDYFGKEIYEGDKCRYDLVDFGEDLVNLYSLEGTVEYKEGGFFLNGLEYKPTLNNYCIRYLKIIGNIYENPELINKQ